VPGARFRRPDPSRSSKTPMSGCLSCP
jgi:hypothetical protein